MIDPPSKDRIGVTKVLVEWNDYQSECFGELIFTRKKHSRHSQVIAVELEQSFQNSFQPEYYLSFTKTPGLRFTEIKLESCRNLIKSNDEEIVFKIVPLFDNQKLDIKNCILEIEIPVNARR